MSDQWSLSLWIDRLARRHHCGGLGASPQTAAWSLVEQSVVSGTRLALDTMGDMGYMGYMGDECELRRDGGGR
jgi:hypothetical protein